jgi:hypothetical protein
MKMDIAELKHLLDELMASLPKYEGSIVGIAAAWYPREEVPVRRVAADGVVLELECDLYEEEQIIAETAPVDWYRRDDDKSVVFIWLESPDEPIRDLYRDHRRNPQLRGLEIEESRRRRRLRP